jgi:cell division septum initiation protein DivIVA
MDLPRSEIIRRDFARTADGYEPDAVDAHLAWLADRVDVLQRRLATASAIESPDELAANAAQHVQDLLQAAGQTALAITEQARREARAIAEGAEHEAAETRRALATAKATIDAVKSHVATLAENARAQQEVADVIRETLESVEFRDERMESGDEHMPEPQPSVVVSTTLSRSGIPPSDELPREDFSPHRVPASHEDLSLLAVNLLLNGASPDEVRGRLSDDFAGADIDAAIEEAQRRI